MAPRGPGGGNGTGVLGDTSEIQWQRGHIQLGEHRGGMVVARGAGASKGKIHPETRRSDTCTVALLVDGRLTNTMTALPTELELGFLAELPGTSPGMASGPRSPPLPQWPRLGFLSSQGQFSLLAAVTLPPAPGMHFLAKGPD